MVIFLKRESSLSEADPPAPESLLRWVGAVEAAAGGSPVYIHLGRHLDPFDPYLMGLVGQDVEVFRPAAGSAAVGVVARDGHWWARVPATGAASDEDALLPWSGQATYEAAYERYLPRRERPMEETEALLDRLAQLRLSAHSRRGESEETLFDVIRVVLGLEETVAAGDIGIEHFNEVLRCFERVGDVARLDELLDRARALYLVSRGVFSAGSRIQVSGGGVRGYNWAGEDLADLDLSSVGLQSGADADVYVWCARGGPDHVMSRAADGSWFRMSAGVSGQLALLDPVRSELDPRTPMVWLGGGAEPHLVQERLKLALGVDVSSIPNVPRLAAPDVTMRGGAGSLLRPDLEDPGNPESDISGSEYDGGPDQSDESDESEESEGPDTVTAVEAWDESGPCTAPPRSTRRLVHERPLAVVAGSPESDLYLAADQWAWLDEEGYEPRPGLNAPVGLLGVVYGLVPARVWGRLEGKGVLAQDADEREVVAAMHRYVVESVHPFDGDFSAKRATLESELAAPLQPGPAGGRAVLQRVSRAFGLRVTVVAEDGVPEIFGESGGLPVVLVPLPWQAPVRWPGPRDLDRYLPALPLAQRRWESAASASDAGRDPQEYDSETGEAEYGDAAHGWNLLDVDWGRPVEVPDAGRNPRYLTHSQWAWLRMVRMTVAPWFEDVFRELAKSWRAELLQRPEFSAQAADPEDGEGLFQAVRARAADHLVAQQAYYEQLAGEVLPGLDAAQAVRRLAADLRSRGLRGGAAQLAPWIAANAFGMSVGVVGAGGLQLFGAAPDPQIILLPPADGRWDESGGGADSAAQATDGFMVAVPVPQPIASAQDAQPVPDLADANEVPTARSAAPARSPLPLPESMIAALTREPAPDSQSAQDGGPGLDENLLRWVVTELVAGPRTAEQIAAVLGRDVTTVRRYADALVDYGVVKRSDGSFGMVWGATYRIVRLVPWPLDDAEMTGWVAPRQWASDVLRVVDGLQSAESGTREAGFRLLSETLGDGHPARTARLDLQDALEVFGAMGGLLPIPSIARDDLMRWGVSLPAAQLVWNVAFIAVRPLNSTGGWWMAPFADMADTWARDPGLLHLLGVDRVRVALERAGLLRAPLAETEPSPYFGMLPPSATEQERAGIRSSWSVISAVRFRWCCICGWRRMPLLRCPRRWPWSWETCRESIRYWPPGCGASCCCRVRTASTTC